MVGLRWAPPRLLQSLCGAPPSRSPPHALGDEKRDKSESTHHEGETYYTVIILSLALSFSPLPDTFLSVFVVLFKHCAVLCNAMCMFLAVGDVDEKL